MLKKIEKKLTRKYILELLENNETLNVNNLNFFERSDLENFLLSNSIYKFNKQITATWNKEHLLKLGKPHNNIPDFESNPHVWLYESENMYLIIYSDCLRKNAFKGTGAEIILKNSISEEDALKEFEEWSNEVFKEF